MTALAIITPLLSRAGCTDRDLIAHYCVLNSGRNNMIKVVKSDVTVPRPSARELVYILGFFENIL